MLSNPDLWTRIEAVTFDDPDASLPFTARLARDNRWSRAYAARVVAEYRRFAYLALTAGHEATPSDEVDQAWHLHLTYTWHYWGVFTEALGRPLHHGPTAGGAGEGRRWLENYNTTLASYEREFGAPPPADIWPDAKTRFRDAVNMRRVDAGKSLILSKRALGFGGAAGLAALAAATAAMAQAAEAAEKGAPVELLIMLGAGALVILLIMMSARGGAPHKKKDGSGDGGVYVIPSDTGGKGGKAGKDADGDGGSDGGSGCGGGCGGS